MNCLVCIRCGVSLITCLAQFSQGIAKQPSACMPHQVYMQTCCITCTINTNTSVHLGKLRSEYTFMHGCERPTHRLPTAGAYNFWIGVKYTRVVPDRKNHRVVIDLVETIVSSSLASCQSRHWILMHRKPVSDRELRSCRMCGGTFFPTSAFPSISTCTLCWG